MLSGAYYLIPEPFMRSTHVAPAQAREAIPDRVLRAVNIVQATRWRINGTILDLMREAWLSGDALGGLPSAWDAPLPSRVSEEEWRKMTPADRARVKYQREQLHKAAVKTRGKRDAFLRKLNIAQEFVGQPSIYMPHFCDFRGRMYPMAQDLNPQSDDLGKALLMFADGKTLGPLGLYWLAMRLSGCAGQDKLTLDERYAWCVEHHELIIDSAQSPFDGHRFWAEADDPWSFLATALEWEMATGLDSPETFVSHLPIPLDGSCNGLQHLSLMARDPVGAKATNCSRDGDRHDLYTEVADVVKRIVAEDAAGGNATAVAVLANGVTRATVKRAVMTTPYGVTERGIQDQLISDGHLDEVEDGKLRAAIYLKDVIVSALSETVSAARDVMAYLQETARVLAAEDRPLSWRTPDGLVVTQAYYNQDRKRVNTLAGRLSLEVPGPDLGLSKKKQALAAAPNVIHSFDAAHLRQTVRSAHDLHDICSFAVVHDSFGTHAADTAMLAAVLRLELSKMYRVDRLAEFHENVKAANPDTVDLPAPPPLGSFDPAEVEEAPYVFG